MNLVRTDSTNPDFTALVVHLDAFLRVLDGEEHVFYAQLNKTDLLRQVVLAYIDDQAVGCGAIREYSDTTTEVKRMFVLPEYRGKGIAGKVLSELEKWAAESGYTECVLETGKRQPEAIRLYQKSGYNLIPNFGKYAGVENSVCMHKIILPHALF
jgi:putative acetyltransferase